MFYYRSYIASIAVSITQYDIQIIGGFITLYSSATDNTIECDYIFEPATYITVQLVRGNISSSECFRITRKS